MFGKQYRFNPTRSQPPNYWMIEKYHKYQQVVRNDLGQRVTVTRERLLEVFVIVERKVMKCSTLFDLANIRVVSPSRNDLPSAVSFSRLSTELQSQELTLPGRSCAFQLGAMHSLSTSLDRLRANIPPPNVRETSFWQSQTVKVPEEQSLQLQVDKEMESMPGMANVTAGAGEDSQQPFSTADEAGKEQQPIMNDHAQPHAIPARGKAKRKRPDPYQLTILHAMQTTQTSIQSLIDDPASPSTTTTTTNDPTEQGRTVDSFGAWNVKTVEEEQAEKLMRVISDTNTRRGREEGTTATTRTSSAAGGGVKRAVDEAVREMAKQARLKV